LVGKDAQACGVVVVDAPPQLPADRLQPLVDVGVDEVLAPVLLGVTVAGYEAEVFQRSRSLQAYETGREAHDPVGRLATTPEPAGYGHRSLGQRLHDGPS
jgi:hypothetical protein